MAKLFINDIEHEVPDGENISHVCESAGVPFNCNTGICGSCQVKVVEGAKNLSELTAEEMDLGCDKENRLSCKCVITSGVVKITF